MAHILVADDQEKVRNILKSLFERDGHTVVLATNGKEALQSYQEQPAEIVVTDILMPDMEGIETIRELKRINPNVKIIAMSGGVPLRPMNTWKWPCYSVPNRPFQSPSMFWKCLRPSGPVLKIDQFHYSFLFLSAGSDFLTCAR